MRPRGVVECGTETASLASRNWLLAVVDGRGGGGWGGYQNETGLSISAARATAAASGR